MSKKLLGQIAIGATVLATVGLSTALYTRIWNPAWNPFGLESGEVVAAMMEKMIELKTVHSSMVLEAEIDVKEPSTPRQQGQVSLRIEADEDATNVQNPKSAVNLEMSFETEGVQFSFGGEVMSFGGDEFYFKIDTLPLLPYLSPVFEMIGLDIDEIKGRWIKIDQESMLEAMKISLPESEWEQAGKELEELFGRQRRMSDEFQKKTKALLFQVKDKLFSVKEELKDEKIAGQPVYHYRVVLEKEGLEELLFGFLAALQDLGEVPDEEFKEAERDLEQGLEEFLQAIGEIEAELWIGKSDFYLYRIKWEKEIDLADFPEAESAEGKVIIRTEIDCSGFDQPLKIEVPDDFIGFEEILETINSFYGGEIFGAEGSEEEFYFPEMEF